MTTDPIKILVLSDSHGLENYVYSIVAENMDCDIIIHLGDGAYKDMDLLKELPGYSDKKVYRVRGNCDMGSDLPVTLFENIGDYKFYITHGYKQQVKYGYDFIAQDARKNERDVVLFGHTHSFCYEKRRGGLYLFNPGAVMSYEVSYGIIEIDDEGIHFFHKFFNKEPRESKWV